MPTVPNECFVRNINKKVKSKLFEHRSVFPTTLAGIQNLHQDPKALSRLMPPLPMLQVLRDSRTSLTEGELEFRLWFGPLPVHWLARHEPGPIPTSFMDRMIEGPLAVWEHQHIFREVEAGVELTDHITLAHCPGWRGLLTRLIFDGLSLRILFIYRHWRTLRYLSKR
jgi:ligand-binding SRPBCC domain-containing protein